MFPVFNCKNSSANSLATSVEDELSVLFSANPKIGEPFYELLDGRQYASNLAILEADVLFNIARKLWLQAENIVVRGSHGRINASDVRKQTVQMLLLCRCSLLDAPCEARSDLEEFLVRHVDLLESSVSRWSELKDSLRKLVADSVKDEQLPVHHYFHMYLDSNWLILTLKYLCKVPVNDVELLRDLIVHSREVWSKYEDVTHSAFICPCTKRLWMLLYRFNLKQSGDFWGKFNEILKDEDEIFSLWLLKEVSPLTDSSNYSFVENILKRVNVKMTPCAANNATLMNFCKVLGEQGMKCEAYQSLWEIFNKHIDIFESKFKSALELVERIDRIQQGGVTNSYEYFLHFLHKFMREFPQQWSRMRGRIYCKLPSHKMKEFSEIGITNLALLFLTLAATLDTKELSHKLQDLLEHCTQFIPLIINIHISVVVLHVRQGVACDASPLLRLVQEASEDRRQFHLIGTFVEGLDTILNASSHFNLRQHTLVDSWVPKYAAACEYAGMCYLINVLFYNVQRMRGRDGWQEWQETLKEHVLPALKLKSVAMSANAPSKVGSLAAMIEANPSSNWVTIFTADLIAPHVAASFIITLLEPVAEDYALPKSHETAILHAWVRCCLLNCENHVDLTKAVMKLRALSMFTPSEKPLISFIIQLEKLNAGQNCSDLCERCFGRLDSWVVGYLKEAPQEGPVMHLYTCMAVLFYRCALLLYHKDRATCLLNRLINTLLLPSQVLIGNPPHRFVLTAVVKTWHYFIEGIFMLDYSNDAYVERTLRDMVVRYLPLFPVCGSPMLKCLEKKPLTLFIFEKIAAAFLSHPSRSTDVNMNKSLRLIQIALEKSEFRQEIVLVVLTPIFEAAIFATEKSVAVETVTAISSGKYGDLKGCIKNSFVKVTEKHLAFNSNKYFQFTNTLAKAVPDDVRNALPNIKKQIVEVERMRGVGYDNTLRQAYHMLQMLLT